MPEKWESQMFCLSIILFMVHCDANFSADRRSFVAAEMYEPSPHIPYTACNNFYEYACHDWKKTHKPIPESPVLSPFYFASDVIQKRLYSLLRSKDKSTDIMAAYSTRKAQLLFHSCMNVSERSTLAGRPLQQLIEEHGGWSLAPNQRKTGSRWNFSDVLGKLSTLGVFPFFQIAIEPNMHNSSQYVIQFSPSQNIFTADEYRSHNPMYKMAFIRYGLKLSALLGSTDDEQVMRVFSLIWNLDKILLSQRMEYRGNFNIPDFYQIMDLKNLTGNLLQDTTDVRRYLKHQMNKTVSNDMLVAVYDVGYFRILGRILQQLKDDEKANFMIFSLVRQMSSKLSQKFINAELELKRALGSQLKLPPKWKTCVEETSAIMPMEVSAMYIHKYMNRSHIETVSIMMKHIKNSLISTIKNVKWMDSETRDQAIKKAQNTIYQVGYPEWIFNVTILNSLLNDIDIAEHGFLKNYNSILRYISKQQFLFLNFTVDREIYLTSPITVNAYYSALMVGIKILSGIIQPPFYQDGAPSAINYGALGSIIGHELSHGFDTFGRLYDWKGNLRDWWTPGTEFQVQNHFRCFVDQYSNYTFFGKNNPANQTVNENIADNAGIRLSYTAFHSHLSASRKTTTAVDEDKTFFLSFARSFCSRYTEKAAHRQMSLDVHSVYPQRVLGTLSNMPEFARAFDCKPGDRYNPPKRCVYW